MSPSQALVMAEIIAVHRLMDVAGVPRETEDGERLSMAQRVAFHVENTVAAAQAKEILVRVMKPVVNP